MRIGYSIVTGILFIGTVRLQEPKSRVPTFPRQIGFVIGISTPRYRHTKSHSVPMTNYNVIKYADVTGSWGKTIFSDGGFSFSAYSIFSTLKHGVSSLPKQENLYPNWSFELVARSFVKCLGLHQYLETEKIIEYN